MANYEAQVVAVLCRELIHHWRRLQRGSKHPNAALRRASGNGVPSRALAQDGRKIQNSRRNKMRKTAAAAVVVLALLLATPKPSYALPGIGGLDVVYLIELVHK